MLLAPAALADSSATYCLHSPLKWALTLSAVTKTGPVVTAPPVRLAGMVLPQRRPAAAAGGAGGWCCGAGWGSRRRCACFRKHVCVRWEALRAVQAAARAPSSGTHEERACRTVSSVLRGSEAAEKLYGKLNGIGLS